MSPEEELFLVACLMAEKYTGDQEAWAGAVNRLVASQPLNLVEAAVALAVDPPGRVDHPALTLLIQVRDLARWRMPRSAEVAGTDPNGRFMADPDLRDRVGEAFENVHLPGD